jgi:carboxyl-terminal processing protease
MTRLLAFLVALSLLLANAPALGAAPADIAGAAAEQPATAAPVATPEAGAALIDQALGYLISSYVDDLASGMLYQTAYDGAVAALRALGKSPQPQTLTFTDNPQHDAATFRAAYVALAGSAGPAADQALLAYAAVRAVTARIDECHTGFLDPEQTARFRADLAGQGTYSGIGIVLIASRKPPTISKVFRDSPAERAGLRALDEILTVDGTDVSQLLPDRLGAYLRGPAGTQVRLTIRRAGEAAPLEFTITRATITIPIFDKRIIDGPNGERIGYMELFSFASNAGPLVRAALQEFEAAGVQYWILDLRDNGGGYVFALQDIASNFIPNGQPVAYSVDRGGELPVSTNPRLYVSPQHPFAVLINAGSASASEAFAAAAQDYGFARTFGQTSSGCLAAAILFDLADGSAISVTIEKVVSPKKRQVNGIGVTPDQQLPFDPARADDPTLQAAVAWLVAQPQPSPAPQPSPSPQPNPSPTLPGLPATGAGGGTAPAPVPLAPPLLAALLAGWQLQRHRRRA